MSTDEPETVEIDNASTSAYSAFDVRLLDLLADSQTAVDRLTTDQFLRDAYLDAQAILAVAGDVDGFIGDKATNIKQNLALLLGQLHKRPEEFLIAVFATMSHDKRVAALNKTIKALTEHRNAIEAATD